MDKPLVASGGAACALATRFPSSMAQSVAAEDVQIGDRVFNSLASHPAYRWQTVTGARTVGAFRVLSTQERMDHTYHPKEGVAVQRPVVHAADGAC